MSNKAKAKTKTKETKQKSKSDVFREMWDEGYEIKDIARKTGDYYSFVHRVVHRHIAQQKKEATKDE